MFRKTPYDFDLVITDMTMPEQCRNNLSLLPTMLFHDLWTGEIFQKDRYLGNLALLPFSLNGNFFLILFFFMI